MAHENSNIFSDLMLSSYSLAAGWLVGDFYERRRRYDDLGERKKAIFPTLAILGACVQCETRSRRKK